MKLITQIPFSKAKNTINYNSQLVMLGSCFSENIGDKLNYFKFQNTQNPFGILFHPLAIEKLIQKAVREDVYGEEDVFYMNERWHCFDAHSSLSNTSKEELLTVLNKAVNSTANQLKTANHIIITLGTAWLYRNTSSKQVVANCHKVPQSNFIKEILAVNEVEESLRQTITLVRSVNSKAQIIFTVSPVRHLKDGFVENQLSKSHLITAIHKVLIQDEISYFPSYEIMMDELREYRFYGKDMIHPNDIAIDYIWEKFIEVWMDDSTNDTMLKVDEVQRSLEHKAFNPEGEAHQKFLTSLKGKIAYIKKEYSFMDFNLNEA